jgi:hypothetical protein
MAAIGPEIGRAVVAAAVAARSPLGLPAEMPHEHEAGGQDENDPGYDIRGGGHAGSRAEAAAVVQTPIVRCGLAFRSAAFVTIFSVIAFVIA